VKRLQTKILKYGLFSKKRYASDERPDKEKCKEDEKNLARFDLARRRLQGNCVADINQLN